MMPNTREAFSGNVHRLHLLAPADCVFNKVEMDHTHVQPRQENICQPFQLQFPTPACMMSLLHLQQVTVTDRESTEAPRQIPTTVIDNLINIRTQVN